jgi:hypothetical protein
MNASLERYGWWLLSGVVLVVAAVYVYKKVVR